MFSFIFNPKSKRTVDEITFKRYIGFYDKNEMIKELVYLKKSLENRNHIYTTQNLEMVFQTDIIQKVEKINSKFNIAKIDFSIVNQLSNLLDTHNELTEISLLYVIEQFLKNEKNLNNSILNNFIVKLISWSNLYCKVNNKSTINLYPPCFIYFGDIKKHETYFLSYINMLGWDVIYINPQNVDPIKEYSIREFKSELIMGTCFGEIDVDDIENYVEPIKMVECKQYSSFEEWIDCLKELDDEVFGEAFIGHDRELKEYSIKLLEINKCLKNKYKNLITIINGIETPSIDECKKIPNDLNYMDDFCTFVNSVIPNSGIIFKSIVTEFSKPLKEDSVLKNFSTKLLIWILRYKDEFIYGNSAIFFFGKIKIHELYFLRLMINLGVSVIYLNPDKKCLNLFREISGINLNEFINSSEMNEYPKENSIKKQETITYKAAKEVEKFIREGNNGIFRPYQLNNKKMNAKILVSTIEEILVIWDEPSQFRTGFLNTDNLVEIPNIFIKINGVYEEIKKYWEMVNKLKTCENCLLIKEEKIFNEIISREEILKATFLFNKDGTLNIDKVMKSDIYKDKLGYLNLEVQYMIMDKIEQLLNEDVFIEEKSDKFKIELLMTVINIDDKFIKMIEKHKLGEKVPKLILYNNDKNNYTIQDVIIIMFLVLIGFDVVFLCPTAYNNIELLIKNDYFQTFRLETIAYDLEMPEKFRNNKKSFLERLFGI